jgi:hypothetical protein
VRANGSGLEMLLAGEHTCEPWQALLDLGEAVKVPAAVDGGRVLRVAVPTCGQGFIQAVFLAGDALMGAVGDIGESFPVRPLSIGPLAWPSADQRADCGDVGKIVGASGRDLVPVSSLADQPGLEVPEPVCTAQAIHDQAGSTPHSVGIERLSRGVQVDLEVLDTSSGAAAEPVLNPLGALPRTRCLLG